MSHYLLETNLFHVSSAFYIAWKDSTMRQWLNSEKKETIYRWIANKLPQDPAVSADGFLHESRFTAAERGAMLPAFDGLGYSVTLPSSADLEAWLPASNDRVARYKPAPGYKEVSQAYWLREDSKQDVSGDYIAYYLRGFPGSDPHSYPEGEIGLDSVDAKVYSARPILVLDLDKFAFKAKLPKTDPSSHDLYMLYREWTPGPVLSLMPDGNLALKFASEITSVDKWPASADFTLSLPAGRIENVTSGGSGANVLILSPDTAIPEGSHVKLSYAARVAQSDGLLLSSGAAAKSGDILAMVKGSWKITKPVPAPAPPSSSTTPGGIKAVVDGETYTAVRQPDGTYLIVLPYSPGGADLTNIPVEVRPPTGGKVTPDMSKGIDCSQGPVKFTITAEDGRTKKEYTLEIIMEEPGPVDRDIADADASKWLVVCIYNEDGTIAVEIRIPLVPGFDPSDLDKLSAVLSSLSNLSFAYVDANGDVVPLSRAADAPYLRISGTAAGKSALESAELSRLIYWLKGDAREYRQTFAPALKLGDMPIEYTNNPPDPDPIGGGSSAGSGFALAACGAAFLLAAKRRK